MTRSQPMTLHATINELAERFAHDLLRALRGASLDEIISETSTVRTVKTRRDAGFVARTSSGKRHRRSADELQKLADQIVAIVMKHPNGIVAGDLKRAFGAKPGNVGAKVFTRPLSVALASKKIGKRGHRRFTTYYAK